ncbi:TetR/AcrR family transcriptional regulator [Streptomyces lydicus]|uniref:TetR/AcrR family transcriptional regulator n=1 Tax=Streptomyces lydicus TaxID=47763 RepID=UPI0036ED2417
MPTRHSDLEARRTAQERRRTPVQARSQRTLENILSAATDILLESGLPALNTNAIATRAGINVSTLYSYFPDKLAIVHELSARFDGMRDTFLAEHLRELATAEEWRQHVAGVIEGLVRFRVEVPGSAALRRALCAMPETEGEVIAAVRRTANLVAAALCRRNGELDREHAELVSLIVSELMSRMLDLAFYVEPYDRAVVREIICLTQRYLAPYLDGCPPLPATD